MTSSMKILKYETYISLIENSVGTTLFRSLWFVDESGQKKDIVEGGSLSCAFFVSSLLLILGLIKEGHATVSSTEQDLISSGWVKITEPKRGAVVIWESVKTESGEHQHIGFLLGNEEAVSNSDKLKLITKHHYTLDNKRNIESIWCHSSFEV